MSAQALRLFVVMLGGRHACANIELHDVVFAVAPSIGQTHEQLRRQWFGEQAGLHIDAWMTVDGVEQWQVRFSAESQPEGAPKLYFVNLGGYVAGEFGEAHHNLLVVAEDAAEAKRKALAQANVQWIKPHRDALLEVDSCLPLDAIDGRHVQLIAGVHTGIASHSDYIVLPDSPETP